MKPGRLYIKIFLSFVLVLIVTEILIFGLFIFAARGGFRSQMQRSVTAHVLIAKEMVEDKIKSRPEIRPSENESLKDVILRLGEAYGAKVWLAGADGIPVVKSFPEPIPGDLQRIPTKPVKDFGNFKLFHGFRRRWEFYAVIPTEIHKGEKGGLHVLFEKRETDHSEAGFALGLAGIGFVIALLIIPVSRLITERVKRLRQSALRIAEGDLSHRVTVKGKDEIGELGRSFNRMADKLERMIRGGRELTANISHEVRSPLARIRVAEELLRERLKRGDYDDTDRHLDDIREDIGELDRLIGSILALSKLDIQETPLKLERLNPADLIKELLERLKPAISHRGLRLKTDLSFGPPVFGDKEALCTAFSNVLENAVKFAPENGDMNVKMHSEQDCLKIIVTNSFKDMAEEELAKIFEPFYRSEHSHAAGSGLGLAITKKIIDRHGGNIEACNSPEGLTIRIWLPAGPSEGEI